MTTTAPTVELVDQPDQGTYAREGQRTYKLHYDGTVQTVRIRRDDTRSYGYVIENLVGGKWHRLLTGDTIDLTIPFDDAVMRAVRVLF